METHKYICRKYGIEYKDPHNWCELFALGISKKHRIRRNAARIKQHMEYCDKAANKLGVSLDSVYIIAKTIGAEATLRFANLTGRFPKMSEMEEIKANGFKSFFDMNYNPAAIGNIYESVFSMFSDASIQYRTLLN